MIIVSKVSSCGMFRWNKYSIDINTISEILSKENCFAKREFDGS